MSGKRYIAPVIHAENFTLYALVILKTLSLTYIRLVNIFVFYTIIWGLHHCGGCITALTGGGKIPHSRKVYRNFRISSASEVSSFMSFSAISLEDSLAALY